MNTVSLPNAGVVGWSSFEFGDEKGVIFDMILKFIPQHFKKMICFICADDNNYHIIAVHPVLSFINLFHSIDITHAMHMFPTISSKDCEQTLASDETPVPFLIHNNLVLFKCCLGNAWISDMYSTCISVIIFRVRYPFIRPLKL